MSDEPRRPTHVDAEGAVHMVGVGAKAETSRRAVAVASVRMHPETVRAARDGDGPKGDVGATVRLAGILGAKRTSDLIPLCHPVRLVSVEVALRWRDDGADVTVTAEAVDRTGVEMEAMTGASVAALALYDMVKGLERGVTIERVALLEKSGGRTGTWRREP